MTLSSFSISTLGLRAQATALHVIGTNVSNVQTGGFKRADVNFQTVLSETVFEQSDIGGTRPKILQRNSIQGNLQPTSSSLDLAIIGQGFFATRSTFDATGETIYTRDGSFERNVLNEISVTDPQTGDVFTTKDAYLVDKNGNYVLGFAANADGTFPTTGTPAPMRVDPNAFIDEGASTTDASLGLNLDSNAALSSVAHITAVSNLDNGGTLADGMEVLTINFVDSNGTRQSARLNFTKSDTNTWDVSATYNGSGTAQLDTISISGVVDAGDTYDVTVNGVTESYTALAGDTQTEIVAGLTAALNANATIAADVTATVGATAGTLTLTGAATGTAFTSSADSADGPDIAQIDTVTLSGTVETSDVYSITIGGNTASYTVLATDATFDDVASGLMAAINATAIVNTTVTASAGTGTGEILITADTAGVAFSTTAAVVDRGPTAQVDTLTLAGTVETGDVYTAIVDGTPVSYTVLAGDANIGDIRNGLLAAINLNGTVNPIVTASAGAALGDLVLTADVSGVAFTTTSTAIDGGGGTLDSTNTTITTTANALTGAASASASTTTTAALTATDDSTAITATSVAAQSVLQNTAVTQLAFQGDGRIVAESTTTPGTFIEPDPIALNFTFPTTNTDPDGTATVDLDITGLTQFATPFLFQRFSENGFEAATMTDISFDTVGHVVGHFNNGRSRELYQIPLAKFINPDGLETHNGMTFTETSESGTATIETVDSSGIAAFSPSTREVSNVAIVDEFTNMIRTQQAYNSSATAFKTADEMYQIASQMKR